MLESLITLLVVAAIVYLIVTYIPLPEPIRTVIWVIFAIFLLLWLLRLLGVAI